MANSFNVNTWMALTSLDLLRNEMRFRPYFNASFNKEFQRNFPTGDQIRVEFPDRGQSRSGLPFNPSAIQRRYATVTFDEPFGVDWEHDSVENLLYTPRGRAKYEKDILQPKIAQLVQDIESRMALYAYRNAANVVGALGTNPTSYDAISGAARQKMAELGGLQAGYDNGIIVPPVVHRQVRTANIALHNPSRRVSQQHEDGTITYADGFDWHESMSLYRHTAGTWAGAVTVTSTVSTDGVTSLGVTCTTGDTFKAGDKISIASVLPVNTMTRRTFGTDAKVFTITADATGASSAATLTISPPIYGPGHPWQNVDAYPQASAALTLWPGTTSPSGKVGVVGVALNKLAFGIVGGELDLPSKAEMAWMKRDPDTGIPIAYICDYDTRMRKRIHRLDTMIGFGSFYNDAAAVAIACA